MFTEHRLIFLRASQFGSPSRPSTRTPEDLSRREQNRQGFQERKTKERDSVTSRSKGRGDQRLILRALEGKIDDLTPEALTRLNQLEAQAKVQIQQTPALQAGFGNFESFISTVTNKELDEIKKTASAELDVEFARKEEEVKTAIVLNIRQLNEQHNLLSERDLFQLEENLKNVKRQTALSLSSNLNDLQQRGLLDSGSFGKLADKIIEASTGAEQLEQKLSEFNQRGFQEIRDVAVDKQQFQRRVELGTIGRERESKEQLTFFDMLDTAAGQDFLQQKQSASRFTEGTTAAETPQPVTTGGRTPAESTTPPARAPGSVPRQSSSRGILSGSITARALPGSTITSRAGLRGAKRKRI